MTASEFSIGQEVSNWDLSQAFGGSPYSAMRVSSETKSIALLVNYANPSYHNYWRGNVLRFSAFRTDHVPQLADARNQRLLNAKRDGYTVLLFERYLKKMGYIFRGEVEVKGVVEDSASSDQPDAPQALSFLLQPMRHKITSELVPILRANMVIDSEDKYRDRFLFKQIYDRDPHARGSTAWVTEEIYSSVWRAYATEVLEPFLADVESSAPGILIPEYQLEQGSIKTSFAVLASVASITGGTMSAVANYPRAKESWPTVEADARSAIAVAAAALQRRFPGVVVLFNSDPQKSPQREEGTIPFGLPPSQPRGEGQRLNYLYNGDGVDE